MTCPEIQDRLTDYAVYEATADERALVEAHVANCVACGEQLADERDVLDALAAHDWDVPPLADAVRERLAREAQTRPRTSWRPLFGLAAAFGGVAIAGTVLTLRQAEVELPTPANKQVVFGYGQIVTGQVQYPTPPPPPPPPLPKGLDKESAEELRSLGYVEQGVDGGVAGGVEGGVPGGIVGGVVGGLPDGPPPPPAPPRERPGAMFFEHKGTNPYVDPREDPLSTFGLDVDTASFTMARNYLERGMRPPPQAVRVEEFVNAFPGDDVAAAGRDLTVRTEAAPSPFRRGYHVLRIGVKARNVASRDRKRAVLTFVVDVSGSMAMENRLGLVKRSLRLLVERLDERDAIGLVVYGTRGRVVLEPTRVADPQTILRAVDSLAPEGSTNLDEGLDLGYAMAARHFDPEASNRVVLCTDGVANNGVVDPDKLLKRLRSQAVSGVFMTALGFGMGNYNDVLLQRLADQGNGQYAYIDNEREAQRFFLGKLTSLLEVVARDARAQVEFDPARVERYRLLGYEKRDIADQRFRDDSVDAGELNAGHAVTVLYELKLRDAVGPLGKVRLRYLDPVSGAPTETESPIDAQALRETFDDATPRFRLGVLVARFAEHLRESRYVRGDVLDVARGLEGLPPELLQRPEVQELLGLVRKAAQLAPAER